MNFSEALVKVKTGHRISRDGWNGKNQFVFLVPGSVFSVNREPLLSILGEGAIVNYRPHLDMQAADGTIGVWLASQSDILADDWFTVEPSLADG